MTLEQFFVEDGEYNEAAILLACVCVTALVILLAIDTSPPLVSKQALITEAPTPIYSGLTHEYIETLPPLPPLPSQSASKAQEQAQDQDVEELDDLAFIEREKKQPFSAFQHKWQMIETQGI